VIGMMAIEMIGAVYCPLSSRDPELRLSELVEQTESRLVLIHYLTQAKFNDDIMSLDIDRVFTDIDVARHISIDRLSSVVIAPKNIAYIIFTSGSTGIPKAYHLPKHVHIWNTYGPAEATVDCTFHILNISVDIAGVPIGHPLSHYLCLILDNFLQSVVISQEGELYVGGVGVFAGYLKRDDLTAKALIRIDDETFYRTGDLVRMDSNGLLHYQGRKDHQIKLHGQRIELGEIEQCLLNTSISACVVIKWNDDHLIAYVQSSNINEEQLHKHCQSHLPPHMIPSIFVILEKLPLNANG
ncbi:unnamed protein product, partial [Rotaria sordida]